MRLLERVSTLIRANLNDMIDRAEDPEKLIKQVMLDMENQYLQVKTQVAVSIADQHMLEKKLRENEDAGGDWMRKAELAVDKSQDELARAALDRFQTSAKLAVSYREQVEDQRAQVETLKNTLIKLEQKLEEAKSKRDLLLARHRRSIALTKAARAQSGAGRPIEKRRVRPPRRSRQPHRIGGQRRSRAAQRRHRRAPDAPRPRYRSRSSAGGFEIEEKTADAVGSGVSRELFNPVSSRMERSLSRSEVAVYPSHRFLTSSADRF